MSGAPGGSSSSRATPAAKAPRPQESYDSLHRRSQAAEILQSYEKLSWYSFLRAESMLQTRLHFQNVVAGFTDQDEAAQIQWPEDVTPRPGEEPKSNRKEREAVVAGPSASSSKGKGREKSQSGSGAGGSAKKKRRSGAGSGGGGSDRR